MTSPKPIIPIRAPLPLPADVAGKREDAVRAMIAGAANRLLYVSSYSSGLVTLQEADGTVIDTPIAWVGALPPQAGDACLRIAIAGRGSRDAAPSYVAFGPVHKADEPMVVEREGSATTGGTPSNSNVSAYVTSQTANIPVGPGTWEVTADGTLSMIHSAGGPADVQVAIDGVGVSRTSQSLSTSLYTRWGSSQRASGLAGNRSIGVTLQFKPNTAGTVNARNPVMRVRAIRVG